MAALVNKNECIGCGACMGECPTSAIEVVQTASVDPDTCVSCGTCVDVCPVDAIQMG
ncbi:MAG: 4Fe-4S binding protein [Dorea sp.]|nr:4Fe-4S binding protein [Dorea sp.]